LKEYSSVGAESQTLLTIGSQHDLVIGIRQVNLGKTIPTTQLPHEIFRKWHRVMMGFQLMVNCNGVVPADPKFGGFSRKCGLTNRDDRSPMGTELRRLPHPCSNASIIGQTEVILDSKGDYSRPAKDWLCLWLEFYLQLKIFQATQIRFEEIWKLLAELPA
jgi:hypothetical protein